MAKVSIIVPIYNVETFLDRSIQSLINQNLKDIEIILVNDGSTDNSLSICRKYENIDNRIRVIDKINGGVSSARNEGIRVATGEYIGFIDPDDWVDNDMYENMYKKAQENQSDIVISNYILENGKKASYISLPIEQDILYKEDIMNKLILPMIADEELDGNSQGIMGTVWRLLIKRELIYNNNLTFSTEIHLAEDLIFCIQAFLVSNKICIDKGYYYHYIVNENSALTKYRESIYNELKEMYFRIENIFEDIRDNEELNKRMKYRYITICTMSMFHQTIKSSNKSIFHKLNIIRNICKDDYLKEIICTLKLNNYSIKKRVLFFSIKYNMYLLIYAYYSYIKLLQNKNKLL